MCFSFEARLECQCLKMCLSVCLSLMSRVCVKGALGTKEFIMHEVAKGLDLQPNRFCLLAALLGNFLLTEEDLVDFHDTLLKKKQAKVRSWEGNKRMA